MPVEEVKIEEEVANGKKKRKKRNMEKYAPLIFEECFVKCAGGMNKVANTFELQNDKALESKVNPSKLPMHRYKGVNLFVMVHGF